MSMPDFILASASRTRRKLLENAGLSFQVDPADIDERAAEEPLVAAGTPPEDLAAALAMIKADEVSRRHAGMFVVGADQTLELDGERFNKPMDMEIARRQLLAMRGRTHRLHSALAVARDGEFLWSHAETVNLTMRDLTPAEIGHYLAAVGEIALESVGAYQIEGRGIQLFERIDGDFFAVLGFPILPFLAWGRQAGNASGDQI
jgi:septum formation protein